MPDPLRSDPRLPPPAGLARLALPLGLAALLSACAHGGPPEVPGSPAEKRLAVVRGTTPGITLWPAARAADDGTAASGTAVGTAPSAVAPAGGAATAPPRPAEAPSTAATAPTPPTPPTLRRFLGGLTERLGPPTGRPLSEQKKLDAPGQGIPLPSSGSSGGR